MAYKTILLSQVRTLENDVSINVKLFGVADGFEDGFKRRIAAVWEAIRGEQGLPPEAGSDSELSDSTELLARSTSRLVATAHWLVREVPEYGSDWVKDII